MTRIVQEEIRPRLTRVEDRGQQLKTLGPAAAQLVPGTAVALLGSPGVDLHRLAADVIRGIPEPTLIVWMDLAELSRGMTAGNGAAESLQPGGLWDHALATAFRESFERALASEGMNQETLAQGLEVETDPEDPAVARIQRFGLLARKLRRWPVIAIEAMHRLPWPVSERLQWILRKALDNGERQPLLRLVLTGSSDFLSGEAIAEGAGFSTSPLYARTARYEVLPYSADQLWELTPLPGGLPDRILEVICAATGGVIGLVELTVETIYTDPTFGKALLEALPEDGSRPPPFFWDWLSRAEGIAEPARRLIREGLGALLSSPKGRSWQIVEALQALLNGEGVEEAVADGLLPLELAGLVSLDRKDGRYHYRFASPLIPPLLKAVLPEGRRLRDQLDLFSRDFTWEGPARAVDGLEPPLASIRMTGGGVRMHVTAPTPPVQPPPPRRTPLDLPPQVGVLVADSSPASARALIELLKEIAAATDAARRSRVDSILTLSQLDIRWLPLPGVMVTNPGGGLAPRPPALEPGTPPDSNTLTLGKWEVRLNPRGEDDAGMMEAAALFVPPDRLGDWLQSHATGQPFVPRATDDAWAMGILTGFLLGREQDPRLMVEAIDRRLTGALELGVGPMLRLERRCLHTDPKRRPTLEVIVNDLKAVLADPYRLSRRILRYIFWTTTVAVIGLGLVDFALDARVDNPNWFYTGVKIVGAAAWAAFYLVAWLLVGRTNKEQIHEQLFAFIRARMNRIRWMVVPSVISSLFALLFAYRLDWNWGVQLTLPAGHKLEEIKERQPGQEDCDTWHKFSQPVTSASVRMRLDRREYVFILDREEPNRPMQRIEYYWPADQVSAWRDRPWGETLYVYALKSPPSGQGCLPSETPMGSPANPADPATPGVGSTAPAGGAPGAPDGSSPAVGAASPAPVPPVAAGQADPSAP